MLSRKLLLSVAVAGMLACVSTTASAQATISNQPVYFTFANPVVLPGNITLQPGQYEFRMTTNKGDREVVQVYNKTDNKQVAQVMSIPAHLTNAQPVPEKAEVRFYETAANQPAPIQSWWYPGIHDGHEFIYPHDQAMQMAKTNPGGVLTTEGAEDSGKLTRLRADGSAADADMRTNSASAQANAVAENNANRPAPAASPAPTPQPRTEAQPAPAPVTQMARTRTQLPRTASALPTMTAVGLLSLFAGFALAFRRRTA
jgi:hypothetical protein